VHNRELRLLVQNASVTKQHAGNGHAVSCMQGSTCTFLQTAEQQPL
jgi:hypothetical protein